jgi:hypothetical protein
MNLIILKPFVSIGFAPKVEKSGDFRSRWNSLGANVIYLIYMREVSLFILDATKNRKTLNR